MALVCPSLRKNFNSLALHLAAENGDEVCAELQLDHGSDMSLLDNGSFAPSIMQRLTDLRKLVHLLLDRGAYPCQKSANLATLLGRADVLSITLNYGVNTVGVDSTANYYPPQRLGAYESVFKYMADAFFDRFVSQSYLGPICCIHLCSLSNDGL